MLKFGVIQQQRSDKQLQRDYAKDIRTCGENKDLGRGRRIHTEICSGKLRDDRYLGNLLIQMYGRCGSVEEARAVFDSLSSHNVFSWTIVIQAHAHNGHIAQAIVLYDRMPVKDLVSCNVLLAMYAQFGDLYVVKSFFSTLPLWDMASWNTIVTAFACKGHLLEAEKLFNEMPEKDIVAWNVMINAYSRAGDTEKVNQLISAAPETDVVTWNSVITACVQVGDLTGAKVVFDGMRFHDVVSFTVMITGYSQCGKIKEARNMFEMVHEKDSIAWNTIILALAANGELSEALELFQALPNKDLALWNAMMTAMFENGRLREAEVLFEQMPVHNVISWSVLISGHAQNGDHQKAIHLFKTMDLEGIPPNEVTFVSVLNACTSLPAPLEGRLVHEEVAAAGLIHNVEIANELLGMYARSGNISQAKKIFDAMPVQDMVSWTAMIAAFSEVKLPADALKLVHLMAAEGVNPNAVTYVAILSACSHEGSVESVAGHFVRMIGDFCIASRKAHFNCVIDVFGRNGRVAEAEELIKCMPFEADDVAWMSLLSGCRVVFELDPAIRALVNEAKIS